MILQMDTAEIMQRWPQIAEAIGKCLPPYTYASAERMGNIQRAAMRGDVQLWKVLGERRARADGNFEIVLLGLLVTAWDFDAISEVRNLSIYALYGISYMADDIYAEGLDVLRKFAKAHGCHRIVALTAEPRLIELAKQVGGDTQYSFLSLEV